MCPALIKCFYSSQKSIGYTTLPSLQFILKISVFPRILALRVISSNSPNANSFLYAMWTGLRFSGVREKIHLIKSRVRLFFTCSENRSLSTEGKLAVIVWLNFEFDCTNRGSKHEWKQICSDTRLYRKSSIDGLDNKNTKEKLSGM